jgi:hypothetical protein
VEKSENNLRQQNQHIKKEQFLEALEKSMGIMSQAAKKIGVDRTTPYKWMREDDDYNDRVKELLNVSLDFVEGKLFEAIQDGNITAIIFYLKTKGKVRGYVERHELAGVDDKELKVEIEVIRTNK